MSVEGLKMQEQWAAMLERRRLRQTQAEREGRPIEPEVEAIAREVEEWEGDRISSPDPTDLTPQNVTVNWEYFGAEITEIIRKIKALNAAQHEVKNEKTQIIAYANFFIDNKPAKLKLKRGINSNFIYFVISHKNTALQKKIDELKKSIKTQNTP